MDRLLCYEVTGIKLDGNDFASDSDDTDESASSSNDGDGDSLHLGSPSRAAGAPSTRSNDKKKGKSDLQATEEMLTALMQEPYTNLDGQSMTQDRVGMPTSYSINI